MLFYILTQPIPSEQSKDIKVSACLCLQELVNVRQGIFDTTD